MKIAHLCVSCFYIDGFSYQENELVREHVRAGHDVLVIASTETIDTSGVLSYTRPGAYPGQDGAPVIRLPYSRWLPHKLGRKLRLHPGLYAQLEKFSPDVILFHGTCGWELLTVASYARKHPETLFYIDSHEDAHNSARNFISREFLHRRYYAPILRACVSASRKILCVSSETIDFVRSVYGISAEQLEFYPLGGHPVGDAEYAERRLRTRQRLGIDDDQILIVQSGKQTRRKRLPESLRALADIAEPRLRLCIAGALHDDIKAEVEALVAADSRIHFLGWQSRDELTDLLCAADVYLQPGTQSATMQQALCCRCAVILDETPAHRIYDRDNGWFIVGDADLGNAIRALPSADIPTMQRNSYQLACELLDYHVLAERVLRP